MTLDELFNKIHDLPTIPKVVQELIQMFDDPNTDLDKIGAKISSISPDKQAPVNLYCRSGRRAEAALQTLKQLGYNNVTNHGGYEDLRKQGLR